MGARSKIFAPCWNTAWIMLIQLLVFYPTYIRHFPQSVLTQPIQAAMRGELNQLLLSGLVLLGDKAKQIWEIKESFASYQMSIKSASNSDSIDS